MFLWNVLVWVFIWIDSFLIQRIPKRCIYGLEWTKRIYLCYKYWIHYITNSNELTRLCIYKRLCDQSRTWWILPSSMLVAQIRNTIKYSNMLRTELDRAQELNQVPQTAKRIAAIKGISPLTSTFAVLESSLGKIVRARLLLTQINSHCTTPYDHKVHYGLLEQLWRLLVGPDRAVPAIPNVQWKELGFQGDNPATDFRAMGIFGLEQLLYFATMHSKTSQTIYKEAAFGPYWYSYAIVGINISQYLVSQLQDDHLLSYLSYQRNQFNIKSVNELYCEFFSQFHQTWMNEQPRDIMEFNRIFDKVKQAWATTKYSKLLA